MPLNFVDRHNGPREKDEKAMLGILGCKTLDELVNQTVPEDIQLTEPLRLPAAVSESEYLAELKKTACRNKNFRSLIGTGFHGTCSPAVITRNIFENPAWYTSSAPYQAEISQGTLQMIYEFQTHICNLTGMDVCNASVYDGATACAEALLMACRIKKLSKVLVASTINPDYLKQVYILYHLFL